MGMAQQHLAKGLDGHHGHQNIAEDGDSLKGQLCELDIN